MSTVPGLPEAPYPLGDVLLADLRESDRHEVAHGAGVFHPIAVGAVDAHVVHAREADELGLVASLAIAPQDVEPRIGAHDAHLVAQVFVYARDEGVVAPALAVDRRALVALQAELAVGRFDSVAGDAKARGEVADLGDEGAGGYAARRYLVADLLVDLPVCGSTRIAVDTDVNVCDLAELRKAQEAKAVRKAA